MPTRARARVFCETSTWIAVPLASAAWQQRVLLTCALAVTMVSSFKHWQHIAHGKRSACWHNLDRLGVLLVLLHVETRAGLALVLLFALGGVLQRLHAEQLHFWCHLFCRYVAFWACCTASGHTSAFFAQDDQNAPVETSIFVVYSVLYLAHICALCSRRDKRPCACVF